MFGTRYPLSVTELVFHHSKEHQPHAHVIALLDEPVQNEGDVFAFTAHIYEAQPFYFQIWRPEPEANTEDKYYRLIAYRQVIPSVAKQHEEVRLSCCVPPPLSTGRSHNVFYLFVRPSVRPSVRLLLKLRIRLLFSVHARCKKPNTSTSHVVTFYIAYVDCLCASSNFLGISSSQQLLVRTDSRTSTLTDQQFTFSSVCARKFQFDAGAECR